MSERVARVLLGVTTGLLVLAALVVDLPSASDGRFWSDGATYHAMASSLAFDLDVTYGPEDLARVRAVYPGGPQGVFLKRVAGGEAGTRLVYSKSMAYPLVAAPFVRLLGADRGLLLTNALALAVSLWLAYGALRSQAGPLTACAATAGLFLASVTPVYLFWLTPELLNLGLITAALAAFLRGRPLLSAALLGIASYSKPYNVLLALPLLLEPLLGRAHGLGPGAGEEWQDRFGPRLRESIHRGAVLAAVIVAAFGLNRLATGELNYQGGERKTFYDRYPFDPGVTFDSAGIWMVTDHLGPLVEGRDEAKSDERGFPPRAPEELSRSFLLNLGYFWVGRFGGASPYFPGVILAALAFLAVGPRGRTGWLALATLVLSWLFYITRIPDNWYGGSGTLGNRYFINLVPLGLLFLPRRREWWVSGGALVGAVALLAPLFASPIRHSLRPGAHAATPAFRRLPAELTMLGDLSVFTDVWRKRRPYNAPGGDPSRQPTGGKAPYFLWFLDDGTYGQESSFDEEGFWIRGGEEAEVVLQAVSPPRTLRVKVTAGPAGDIVTLRMGRERQRLVLNPLRTQELTFEAGRPILGYYGTALYRLRFASRYGGPGEGDPRRLGSFVRLVLE